MSTELKRPNGIANERTMQPTEQPSNVAWGDADGKTLYMTARTGLYRIRLNIPGLLPVTVR